MVNKVVSTKLNEEEHNKLLDICNKHGCTPSSFIKESILIRISNEEPKETKKMTLEDLLKALNKKA